MTTPNRPAQRPLDPRFSSGPCTKRPGWTLQDLGAQCEQSQSLGRSHRAAGGKARLKLAIDTTHRILGLPGDYRVAIMPASDTGAFEAAMWSLLGARGVDILAWESFGKGWVTDIVTQLGLSDVRVFEAPYGCLPDLASADFTRDVVFTWNGTTSGVRVPDGHWIASDRTGLTLCDATSAAFAQDIDWPRIDVATLSWQKVLGGEAQHGILILSPRAVARLESYTPPWPMPKIFRLTKSGKLNQAIFAGATINTPSMLCLEDYLDALQWADSIGGLSGLFARCDANAARIAKWVGQTPWVDFLAIEPSQRSNTSICLTITDPEITGGDLEQQTVFANSLAALLETEGVAYDIGAYRDAPPGLRIWTGATVAESDIACLTEWLDWAFATLKAEHGTPR